MNGLHRETATPGRNSPFSFQALFWLGLFPRSRSPLAYAEICPIAYLDVRNYYDWDRLEISTESKAVPTFFAPQSRRSRRVVKTRRASVVVNLGRRYERLPCLIVDSSPEGFRLRGVFRLRRGQAVEVIPDDDPQNAVRCSVVWVGKPGSKLEGELGLQAV
jgi:hypothetical protein